MTVAWYNASWLNRKSHLINHGTSNGTNYQVAIKVFKTTGTDGSETTDINAYRIGATTQFSKNAKNDTVNQPSNPKDPRTSLIPFKQLLNEP